MRLGHPRHELWLGYGRKAGFDSLQSFALRCLPQQLDEPCLLEVMVVVKASPIPRCRMTAKLAQSTKLQV